MNEQTTHTILMVEPASFGFNPQTAVNNYFQQSSFTDNSISSEAHTEFLKMKNILSDKGINVWVVVDTLNPHKPDAIFPNNWISFHEDGRIAIYPMFAKNRRTERHNDILARINQEGFPTCKIIDYTAYEKEHKFLEGTGSMVLDRIHRIAYASISERTHKKIFVQFCLDFGYLPITFHSYQTVENQRLPIYHTNVMMCIADKYVVVCMDSIDKESERNMVALMLARNSRDIIQITEQQMHCFAGNMLQVKNKNGVPFLIMSQSAHDSLTLEQKKKLLSYNEIVAIPIPIIEKYGGGSVRCMIAEVFLLQKDVTGQQISNH